MANANGANATGDDGKSGSVGNDVDGNQGSVLGTIGVGQPVTIDPATVTAANGPAPATDGPRKRGRRPKSTAPGSVSGGYAETTLDISGIEKILLSSHLIMATMMKAPNLALDQKEARALAEATVNVTRHYNVQATQKTIDWVNFATTAFMIYGTRAIAYGAERKKQKAADQSVTGPQPAAGIFTGGPQQPGVMQ